MPPFKNPENRPLSFDLRGGTTIRVPAMSTVEVPQEAHDELSKWDAGYAVLQRAGAMSAGGGDPGGGEPGGPSLRIIVLAGAGQSNEVGTNDGTGVDPSTYAPDARIIQINQLDVVGPAAEPLPHPSRSPTDPGVGHLMPMAKGLLSAGLADIVAIAPLAVGCTSYVSYKEWAKGVPTGTGFQQPYWLYKNAIDRLTALKAHLAATYPGATVEWCFTGHAGENDNGQNYTAYQAAVKESFDGIIAAVGIAGATIIKSDMSPGWIAANYTQNQQQAAQRNLRERMRTYVIASPDGPYDANTSNIHFAAAAKVEQGNRMVTAYPLAKARAGLFNPHINLCDELSAAPLAAYSLYRRLRSSYAGAALRIRRTSDAAELDIGFDADGRVDIAAISAFCAGTTGSVLIWYDQSGNGHNFGQIDATTLPILTNGSGVIRWLGNRPMLGGAGSGAGMVCETLNPSNAGSVMIAGSFPTSGGSQLSLFENQAMKVSLLNGRVLSTSHNAGSVACAADIVPGVHVITAVPATAGRRVWIDGSERTPLVAANGASSGRAGATTILGRQVTAAGAIDFRSTAMLSEIMVATEAWSDTDRALLHAGTVPSYFPDPYS